MKLRKYQLFPFIIGKVLTTKTFATLKGILEFPFLIGKVLTL